MSLNALKLNWIRYLRTTWGQRIFSFFLPFRVRPSEFVQRKVHPVYGKMSGIPFAPLVPASFIFASAYVMIMNAENKLFANDIWSGKSAAEIISRHDVEVKMTYWVG